MVEGATVQYLQEGEIGACMLHDVQDVCTVDDAMFASSSTIYACWSTLRISLSLLYWGHSLRSVLETSALPCRGHIISSTSASAVRFPRRMRQLTGLRCSSRDASDSCDMMTTLGIPTEASTEEILDAGRRYNLINDFSRAVEVFRQAANLDPRSAVALSELGRALVHNGKVAEGFEMLISAFELDSLCPGLKEGFRDYYRIQIQVNPGDIDLHEGLAALYRDWGRPEEAAACYLRCLELSAGLPRGSTAVRKRDDWHVALFKCHAALCDWKGWDTEVDELRAVVQLGRRCEEKESGEDRESGEDPAHAFHGDGESASESVFPDTDGAERSGPKAPKEKHSVRRTSTLERSGIRPVVHPFDSLSAPLSASDCLAVAREQSLAVLAESERVLSRELPKYTGRRLADVRWRCRTGGELMPSDGRLRLGYVSGDLMGSHPLTHLMQSVFGMHDQGSFEIFLYALNPADGSRERKRLEHDVEHFRDVSALSSLEAAEAIARDGVSVLVNLNGYAGTARSADIFALRPADIAISYMGFPGTLGSAELVDYILADRVVIPRELRRYYAEKVLEMPRCYFVNDYVQSELAVITSPPVERSGYGLPPGGDDRAGAIIGDGRRRAQDGSCHPGNDAVVLCNFNRLHKIDPDTFRAWMKVLKTTPGAVLWLLDGGEVARANLRREASLAGVEEERLIFAPFVGKQEHLKRLRSADLFVDTPLYNAHTVGCDALWAGVPMVTLRGEKMAERVGASLLLAAGLPELVTDSMEEYTRLAQELTRDSTRRRRLRQKLAGLRTTCPLFDTRQWVLDAESVFSRVWERHQAGLPPAHLTGLDSSFEEDPVV